MSFVAIINYDEVSSRTWMPALKTSPSGGGNGKENLDEVSGWQTIQVNIQIMRIFTKLREMLIENLKHSD